MLDTVTSYTKISEVFRLIEDYLKRLYEHLAKAFIKSEKLNRIYSPFDPPLFFKLFIV